MPYHGLGLRTVLLLGVVAFAGVARGQEAAPTPAAPAPRVPSAERGWRWLTESAWLPPAFDEATFSRLWETWPEALRERARASVPAERRRMAFDRYGLTPRPGDDAGRPLQYVVDAAGRWSMTCFACHAGQVAGRVVPGLPNTEIALQTLLEDVAALRGATARAPSLVDAMWSAIPMGTNHGTTNAVMFSVALLAFRDTDLNVVLPRKPPRFVHHDLDAPPWWNVRKRSRLYLDGFAPKGHRSLMQFLLVPTNGPDRLRAWEDDFRDVLAWIESVEAPRWPHAVDDARATAGRVVFDRACASCHGTHGRDATYPQRTVPIDVVGTDRVRHEAIRAEDRATFARSWFTGHDPSGVVLEPAGYVAPPLDGIWASAPYFHNGSVPTLWHVLHPDARPAAWRRTSREGYDRERVGLAIEERAAPPADLADPWDRRAWFDTSRRGKSAAGHRFPEALTEEERRDLLEYLKTL